MPRKTKTILLLAIALLLSGIWFAMWLTRSEPTGSEPRADKMSTAMRQDAGPVRTTDMPQSRFGTTERRGGRTSPTPIPIDPRDSETCDASMRAGLNALRGRLDPSASAADAAAHALLGYILPVSQGEEGSNRADVRITRELELATQRFPDDADLAWLRLLNCPDGCDRAAARKHLLRLENRNAVAWLVAMSDAHRAAGPGSGTGQTPSGTR